MELHPDKNAYFYIWERLISPQLEKAINTYRSCASITPDAKELIWEKYTFLNSCCKHEYMTDPEGRLDRHKVAACYLIAIARVEPVKFISAPKADDRYFVINEKIAISTAMSIVRAYALFSFIESSKTEDEKENIKKRFEEGLRVPSDSFVHHGRYMDNFASEIYYTNRENKLHVLSIAHELFLLEVITMMSDLQEQ